MPPLVSIIIPCLNAAPWLAEALQSCREQTYPNVEVIFVDNGSTDGSVEIAKRFQWDKMLVVHCKRKNASAARNEGLLYAKGEFIQYLDADDLISREKIENQVELLRQNPPDTIALSSMGKFLDGTDYKVGLFHDGQPLIESDDPVGWLVELLNLEQHALVPVGSWLTPRNLIVQAGPWNEDLSINDDGEFFARVVLNAKAIRKPKSGVYFYRQFRKAKNLSSKKGASHLRSNLRALDLIGSYLMGRADGERMKHGLARQYMELAYGAYPAHPDISKTALERVSKWGGTAYKPRIGSWRIELLRALVGWKTARLTSYVYHKLRG